MSENIVVDYAQMEEGAAVMTDMSQYLEELVGVVTAAADRLDEGALLGTGGQTISEGLRGKLASSIQELSDKYSELAADIRDVAQRFIESESGTLQ